MLPVALTNISSTKPHGNWMTKPVWKWRPKFPPPCLRLPWLNCLHNISLCVTISHSYQIPFPHFSCLSLYIFFSSYLQSLLSLVSFALFVRHLSVCFYLLWSSTVFFISPTYLIRASKSSRVASIVIGALVVQNSGASHHDTWQKLSIY